MAFRLQYQDQATRQIRKLDRGVAKLVLDYMDEVATLPDPRLRGRGLLGPMAGLWRYRVGDYRVICRIHDGQLVVLVLEVIHRGRAYR